MRIEYASSVCNDATTLSYLEGKASESSRKTLSTNAQYVSMLLAMDRMSDAEFRSKWGPHGYGALPIFYADYANCNSNLLRYWNDVQLVGDRTGFNVSNARWDYAKPRAIAAGEGLNGHYCAFRPSSLNLQSRAPRSAENLVYYELRNTNDTWRSGLIELGLEPNDYSHPGNTAISRIQSALIGDALRRAIPDDRSAAHNVLLRHAPSLSGNGADILASDEDTDQLRDAIFQVAVLMLFPRWLRRWAKGKKRSAMLDALGLPRSTVKLLPSAVGAIASIRGFSRNPFRDAVLLEDLAWLTERVCNSLPQQSFRQRILATIMTRISSQGVDPARYEEIALWLCRVLVEVKNERELPQPLLWELHEYLSAPPELIDAAALRKFNPLMAFETVLEEVADFAKYIRAMNGLEGPPFIPPRWSPLDCQLPNSTWHLERVRDPAELFAAANVFNNCAATKIDVCRRGISALYVIKRLPVAGDKPSSIHRDADGREYVAGAMLELVRGSDGCPLILQLRGRNNSRPTSSIYQAINRLLAA